MKQSKYLLSIVFLLIFGLSTFASPIKVSDKEIKQDGGIKTEIKDYITHHLKDSHSYSLTSWVDEDTGKKVYLELPLPVILYDNGFHFFMSSKLKHGKTVVESNGNF